MINSSEQSSLLSNCTKTTSERLHEPPPDKQWYVMRDLKRSNAKMPAYKMLQSKQLEVFTPMKWQVTVRQGKRIREQVPFIRDLLFVHSVKEELDLIVDIESTLQYRYLKGGYYRQPMVVRQKDMELFIKAVASTDSPHYYSPEEITPAMIGRKALIVGGALNSYEVKLLKIRGAKHRRILIELPGIIATSIEVSPEFIQLI